MRAASCPWVIVGCGYTGERLARRLAHEGARVVVTRRRQRDAQAAAARVGANVEARVVDLRDPEGRWPGVIPAGAIVVDSVPPGDDGGEGERRLVRACAGAGARRLVYLSSTGVYPTGDGGWVDEDSPVGPSSERGQRRLDAETALLSQAEALGVDAVALRIAAIYGPGRGVQERLRAGTYRIVGAGDAYVSRIHVHDLVASILAAGTAAALPRRIYTVADETPMTSRAYADAVAEILDLPPPPSVPPDEVDPAAVAMLASNRKISSRRLRDELGVAFDYPDALSGVRAELKATPASRRS